MLKGTRLSGNFVRAVRKEGRFGDGRGSYGLVLRVKAASTGISKVWVQRLRRPGAEPREVGLGVYPMVSLERARELAFENAKAMRDGIDPVAHRRQRATIPTFRQAAERVIEKHSVEWRNANDGEAPAEPPRHIYLPGHRR